MHYDDKETVGFPWETYFSHFIYGFHASAICACAYKLFKAEN
jgi:hypothetical protein